MKTFQQYMNEAAKLSGIKVDESKKSKDDINKIDESGHFDTWKTRKGSDTQEIIGKVIEVKADKIIEKIIPILKQLEKELTDEFEDIFDTPDFGEENYQKLTVEVTKRIHKLIEQMADGGLK